MTRRRLGVLTGVGVVAVIALVGLVAPDDTKQESDQAAAVTATQSITASTPPASTSATTAPSSTIATTPAPGTATAALATLETLPVKGRAPKTGYSREQFGQTWSDDVDVASGRNGCDTRNDILRRDLTATVLRPGTRDCLVLSGTLADPYTGRTIAFTRGAETSDEVQIDHVVALSDAWQKGAQQLSPDERRDFANDPRNLQATDGPTNQQKGDGDAATWLPPNRGYRCTYVERQITVKSEYRLWVTAAEKDAMARVLAACGGALPIVTTTTAEPPPPPPPAPATTEAPRPLVPAAPPGGGSVYYKNCGAAKAAGAAPLRVGDPGYRTALDRDGDGVACE